MGHNNVNRTSQSCHVGLHCQSPEIVIPRGSDSLVGAGITATTWRSSRSHTNDSLPKTGISPVGLMGTEYWRPHLEFSKFWEPQAIRVSPWHSQRWIGGAGRICMNNRKISTYSQYERARKLAEDSNTREYRRLGFRRTRGDSPSASADHPYPRTRRGDM